MERDNDHENEDDDDTTKVSYLVSCVCEHRTSLGVCSGTPWFLKLQLLDETYK